MNKHKHACVKWTFTKYKHVFGLPILDYKQRLMEYMQIRVFQIKKYVLERYTSKYKILFNFVEEYLLKKKKKELYKLW